MHLSDGSRAWDGDTRGPLCHVAHQRVDGAQAFFGLRQAGVLFICRHNDPAANFFDASPAALTNVVFHLADLNAGRRDTGVHHTTPRAAFAGQKA